MKYVISQLPISSNHIFREYKAENFDINNYVNVYQGNCIGADESTCDDLFVHFNFLTDEHFAGHSLSVSDVITFISDEHKIVKRFYCDSIGWKEIPLK